MPLLRLIGLTLFITAIFLALVAAITQTTHIQVQLPGFNASTNSPALSGSSQSVRPQQVDSRSGLLLPPNSDGFFGEAALGGATLPQAQAEALEFTSVPIIWPLIIAAGVGLLMWFTHLGELPRVSKNAAMRRRK